jgi:hypothetical protein
LTGDIWRAAGNMACWVCEGSGEAFLFLIGIDLLQLLHPAKGNAVKGHILICAYYLPVLGKSGLIAAVLPVTVLLLGVPHS